jgi:hypothetical protein
LRIPTFEDCDLFCGDNTAWKPTWKSGKTLQEQSGKAIRLEVELKSARIFAIRGNLTPLIGADYGRFTREGVIPEAASGF